MGKNIEDLITEQEKNKGKNNEQNNGQHNGQNKEQHEKINYDKSNYGKSNLITSSLSPPIQSSPSDGSVAVGRGYDMMYSQNALYRCMFCRHELHMSGVMCPFCGASHRFIVPNSEFYHYEITELTEIEEQDLLKTIELEFANKEFYREAENEAEIVEFEGYYRNGRRHEGYHLEEAVGVLDGEIEDYEDDVELLELPDSDEEIFQKAIEIEMEAIGFYEAARMRSESEKLYSFYTALIEAETYHTQAFDRALEILRHKYQE